MALTLTLTLRESQALAAARKLHPLLIKEPPMCMYARMYVCMSAYNVQYIAIHTYLHSDSRSLVK